LGLEAKVSSQVMRSSSSLITRVFINQCNTVRNDCSRRCYTEAKLKIQNSYTEAS
jgi:hypothetical protein